MVKVLGVVGAILLLWGTAPSAENSAETAKLVRSARNEIKLKNIETAQGLLQQALIRNPKSAVAHNLLGVCQAQRGHFEEARESFEQAIRLDAKFASAYVNLGNLLLGLHDEAEAMKSFKAGLAVDPQILTRGPSDYAAFNIWGLSLMEDLKYADASRAFQRSIRINPKFSPAHVNLGNALVALKHEDAALKEFVIALAIQPKDFLARYNAGLIYARQGKFELAAKHLRQAHEISPSDKPVLVALTGAEISLGHEREAEVLLAELGGPNALDSATNEKLALLWLENGEPTKAAEFARGDENLARDLYKLGYEKAEVDLDRGNYAEAAKILEAIRGLQPPHADFHDLLGSIYYALDDPQRASDEFQAALRLEPEDPNHYYKLGMVFLKHRTPDPAIYVFETATKARPDAPRLWLGLGLSYFFASRLDQAEKALRGALALDPQYQTAYVVLGDLLEQAGRPDDSVAVLRQATDLQPNWYLPYYYYGKVALRRGQEKSDKVIGALRKALALNPKFPEAHYELGKALARAGQTQEAIKELEKSLELNPDLAQSHYQLGIIYRELGQAPRASEQFRLFEAGNKKENPNDLIQRLKVQIEDY